MESFKHYGFLERLSTMLKVDFRRMFTMKLFYIMMGICLVIPILVLVMTTTASESADADTFVNTWQIIGSVSGENSGAMSLTSMCNINLVYFIVAVLVSLFISEDFKSGYSKNLFTVRSKKNDYIISKILVCSICGVTMLLAFLVGGIMGGAISGLSFDTGIAGISGIILCMVSKILLIIVFVPIYVVMGVVGKQKTWLSMILSFAVGMLLFPMIPVITPLDSTMMNVILCVGGSAMFSLGLGYVGNLILQKTSLV